MPVLATCVSMHMCSNPFCLGKSWCSYWDCCCKMEPLAKKAKIKHKQFLKLCTWSEMEEICKVNLTGALEVHYWQFCEEGVGAFVKHAPWNRHVPTFLLHCIIYFLRVLHLKMCWLLIYLPSYLFIVVSTILNELWTSMLAFFEKGVC